MQPGAKSDHACARFVGFEENSTYSSNGLSRDHFGSPRSLSGRLLVVLREAFGVSGILLEAPGFSWEDFWGAGTLLKLTLEVFGLSQHPSWLLEDAF